MAVTRPKWKLPDSIILNEATKKLYDVLNNEADMVCGILAAGVADGLLAAIIGEMFVEKGDTARRLLSHGGALSDFSNRAALLYCLGVIPLPLFQNLERLGSVRNRLAHDLLKLDFQDEDVRTYISKMTVHGIDAESLPFYPAMKWPRNRFMLSTILTVSQLQAIRVMNEVKRQPSPTAPAEPSAPEATSPSPSDAP